MIIFKEQDGLIFKMLDKPVPLTPDAEVPCLVRFRMPFLERFRGKHEGVAFFCDAIKKNPLYGYSWLHPKTENDCKYKDGTLLFGGHKLKEGGNTQ